MRLTLLKHALVLGLLTAIGPFAIDMYLPALPSIGANLGVSDDAVLLSLTAFFVSFALGQLVYGPLSDIIGRKPPLYFGITLFVIASVGCALAPSIEVLIAWRVLQGLGGAAGMIIARAIVRDMYSGIEETRLFSMLMLVFSVSPILAPLIGSVLIEAADWRAVFWLVGGWALIGLLLSAFAVKETRPAEKRVGSDFRSVLVSFKRLLGDWNFLGLGFIGAFGISAFFVFLSNSSFILMERYGLSSLLYGLCFSLNAVAFFAVAQLNAKLGERFGLRNLVRPAALGFAATTALLFLLFAVGVDQLWLMIVLLFVGYGFLGVYLPVTSVLALEDHGDIAGAASSFVGVMHLLTGAIVMAVSGLFSDGSATPMLGGIALCAFTALVLAQLTLGKPRAVAAAEVR